MTDNKFIDCGFGSTKYCDAIAVVIETEAKEQAIGVHNGITIKDNIVIGNGTPFSLACCENVAIKNNHCIKCDTDIPTAYTKNIIIEDNNFC